MRTVRDGRARGRGFLGLWWAGVVLTGGMTACAGGSEEPTGPRPSAVVLVTVDTLRADGVSFTGTSPATSPFLDSLATKGVVFTHAYAPSSWTAPSMASLFTGLEPAAHGVVSGVVGRIRTGEKPKRGVKDQPLLPQSLTTLAESFQAAGYVTIGVPSNLHLAASLGFGQGFDHYYGESRFLEAADVNVRVREQLEAAFGPEWKTTWKKQKTFLWIHYFDPHVPYNACEPWIDEYAPEFATNPSAFPAGVDMPELIKQNPRPGAEIRAKLLPLYHSEVHRVDEHLRLLDQELGLGDDDVLLVMTSDHGEEFGEHGRLGHGEALFDETLRVPLMLHWPVGLPAGKRIDAPASILDVYPTLAELAGLRRPSGIQGRLLRDLLPTSPSTAAPLYFHTDRARIPLYAVRDGSWKLLLGEGLPPLLFDLSVDPTERNNVAGAHPEVAQRLMKGVAKHRRALPPPPDDAGQVPVTNAEDQKRLEDLGYAP